MPARVKYPQLTDKAWVIEQLKIKSQAELAKEVGCKRSSVAYVVQRYFNDAEQAEVKIERLHKPKLKQDKISKGIQE